MSLHDLTTETDLVSLNNPSRPDLTPFTVIATPELVTGSDTPDSITGYTGPDGCNPYYTIPSGTQLTVKAVSTNDPNWVLVTYTDSSTVQKPCWVYLGSVNSAGEHSAMPLTEEDKKKMIDLYYKLVNEVGVGVFRDSENKDTSSDPISGMLATTTASTELWDQAVTKAGNEIVVLYDNSVTVSDLYKQYLILAIRAYGAPPQWTPFVDPRIMELQTSFGNRILIGRRFAETVVASPTIVSLCPGVVRYNSVFGETLELTGDSDEYINDVADVIQSQSGRIIEFEPCWYNTKDGGNFGYLKYVNTLNIITAIAMSRESANDDEAVSLADRCFPGTGIKYKDFDWKNYDSPDTTVQGILSGFDVSSLGDSLSDVGSTLLSSLTEYKYINFYCSGANSTKENFETSVRSSSIDDMINGNLSSSVRDLAFYTGGLIGNETQEDLQKWSQDAAATLGDLGGLLSNAASLFSGGHLVLPQVVDDCTFGRDCQFTVRFVAGSASQEARYLMRCEYNHFLAFMLPRQVKGTLDMYTTPFLVKANCRGRFNCEIGVVTNVNVTYGGADDNAWGVDCQPNEIEVSFSITPLYSKLYMSSYDDIHTIFMRNTGLMEYIVSNCGVDMRMSQLSLKAEIITGLGTGKLGTIPDSLTELLFDSKIVNSVRNWLSF